MAIASPTLNQALLPDTITVAVESKSATIELIVPNLPWFDGHFDGEPVLPGIALVLWAKAAFTEHFSLAVLQEIPRVKFRQVIGPGAKLQLRLKVGRRLAFSYLAPNGSIVCSGEFKPVATLTEPARNVN